MRIGGLQKLSLIDYPGKTAAVIFTQGCNFRCPYCHNPGLVYPERFTPPLPFEDVLTFLEERRGLLEGVVFSGGEPTLQGDLLDRIRDVRSLGYSVKLDTNGSDPDALAEALPLVDHIAMDIKAPLGALYSRVCGVEVDDYEIRRSILLIQSSGVPHRFRTTFDKRILDNAALEKILSLSGKSEFNLQECIIDKGGSFAASRS